MGGRGFELVHLHGVGRESWRGGGGVRGEGRGILFDRWNYFSSARGECVGGEGRGRHEPFVSPMGARLLETRTTRISPARQSQPRPSTLPVPGFSAPLPRPPVPTLHAQRPRDAPTPTPTSHPAPRLALQGYVVGHGSELDFSKRSPRPVTVSGGSAQFRRQMGLQPACAAHGDEKRED